jgi:hypothetical protein
VTPVLNGNKTPETNVRIHSESLCITLHLIESFGTLRWCFVPTIRT